MPASPRHHTDPAAVTSTMLAVVQHRYGAPQRVLETARTAPPTPGDDDVLVRVQATSVNTPDLIAVTGQPRILRLKTGVGRPVTPVRGSDVAGTVEAVGRNVTDLQPGDEVFGSVWDGQPIQAVGTFAELTVVPAAQLARRPTSVDVMEAGAAVMAGLTAMNAIRDVGGAAEGTRVLINGASGGVGTMAVQIAKALGAEVTGVCSTKNVDLVRSLGADHVIDYTREDFVRSTERYDVVLDNVLNRPPSETVELLTPKGVLVPNSAGPISGLLGGMPRATRAMTLSRRQPDNVRLATCAPHRDNLTALGELLGSGRVKVVLDRVYGLEQTAQAVEHMLGRHARGKVAIRVAG
jgi:NADPH:quinone reductase-like Zn-dependent oxidoreductase